ncbi:MAG: Glycosyltransferase family 9 (heptosyltransferase) [Firmicutes bacterium ADurb.Bin419]|nr:MAG: Glycosyltransferase family 9 (heptosyltransferase) [Firmicutes bacterium ADurb.Bin419]
MSVEREVICSNGSGIVEFTPTKILYAPARGGVSNYSMLEPFIPYVMIDASAKSFASNDVHAKFEYLPDKPAFKDMENLTIFFPGGIGDVICLKACLELLDTDNSIYPNLKSINMFSTKDDIPIILDGAIKNLDISIMNYPPHYNAIEDSDAIIGFGPLQRKSMHHELSDTMASILGMPMPKKAPTLIPNESLKNVLSRHLKDNGRKKIGIQVYSSAHYRSIPPHMAMWIAMELADLGYDVFIIGITGQRLKLFENGAFASLPDNIYDMSGILSNWLDEFIAFTDLMDGFVTPDTSMVHMAGSLMKPTIALFGPTSGQWRTSYYPTVVTMSAPAECAPCYNIEKPMNCGKQWCDAITGIETSDIVMKLHELLC